MIGDYLGERSDFNEAVLKAFVELHDFTNLILVQALRQFFRLPREAQKIDRDILIKQITQFVNEISDEFKIVVVKVIKN